MINQIDFEIFFEIWSLFLKKWWQVHRNLNENFRYLEQTGHVLGQIYVAISELGKDVLKILQNK